MLDVITTKGSVCGFSQGMQTSLTAWHDNTHGAANKSIKMAERATKSPIRLRITVKQNFTFRI